MPRNAKNSDHITLTSTGIQIKVFYPDPISTSGDTDLNWNSSLAALEINTKVVAGSVRTPERGERYQLRGTWCEIIDYRYETPNFPPPSSLTTEFNFPVQDRDFVSCNAFYWLERFASYAKELVPDLPLGLVECDPHARHRGRGAVFTNGKILLGFRYGAPWVPAAADMSVLVHEYVHAISWFLGKVRNVSSFEHAFCDSIAVIYRHLFLDSARLATQGKRVFPFYDNTRDLAHFPHGQDRVLDTLEKFDSVDYASYGNTLQQTMLATVFFNFYLELGGHDEDESVRQRACRTAIEILLNTLKAVDLTQDASAAEAQSIVDTVIGLIEDSCGDAFTKAALKNAVEQQGLVCVYSA